MTMTEIHNIKQVLYILAVLIHIVIFSISYQSFYVEWNQLQDKSQLIFRTISCILFMICNISMTDICRLSVQELRFLPLGVTTIVINFTQVYVLAIHSSLLPPDPTLMDWMFHVDFVLVDFFAILFCCFCCDKNWIVDNINEQEFDLEASTYRPVSDTVK